MWEPALIYLLLGAGLFFSVLTRFVQVRLFRRNVRLLFSSKESDRGISSFQALAVSLSGRVGTGNIAGVAAAIGFGGPGAVFWMWVVAFLGASTAYVESALGQIYKEEDEGQFRGGPAYYIEKALGQKWYAWILPYTTIIAVGVLLPGVQSNSIGNAAELAFGGERGADIGLGSISYAKTGDRGHRGCRSSASSFSAASSASRMSRRSSCRSWRLGYILMAVGIIVIYHIAELPGIIDVDCYRCIFADGGSRRSYRLGRETRRLFERGGPGYRPARGRGIRSAASGAAGTGAGVFGLHRYAVCLLGDGVHDPDHESVLRCRTGRDRISGGVLDDRRCSEQPCVHAIRTGKRTGRFRARHLLPLHCSSSRLRPCSPTTTSPKPTSRIFGVPFKFPGELTIFKIVLLGPFSTARFERRTSPGASAISASASWPGSILSDLDPVLHGQPAIKALKDYEEQRKAGVTNYTFDPKKLGIKNADFWEK